MNKKIEDMTTEELNRELQKAIGKKNNKSDYFVCADIPEIKNEELQKIVGVKYDSDKLRYDLMPPEVLQSVVQVLTNGAKKYADNNWKNVPDSDNRYYAAAMRHVQAWRMGELLDEEDGLPHLSHAICCLSFLLFNQLSKPK